MLPACRSPRLKAWRCAPSGHGDTVMDHAGDVDDRDAAAALITLPVVVLTLVIQRWIVTGLTMGAVKG